MQGTDGLDAAGAAPPRPAAALSGPDAGAVRVAGERDGVRGADREGAPAAAAVGPGALRGPLAAADVRAAQLQRPEPGSVAEPVAAPVPGRLPVGRGRRCVCLGAAAPDSVAPFARAACALLAQHSLDVEHSVAGSPAEALRSIQPVRHPEPASTEPASGRAVNVERVDAAQHALDKR